MECWYVVQTQSNAEAKAVFHLRNQGIEVLLPRYRKEICHAGKKQMVLRALFPGYLFVKLNVETSKWRSINGTVGVVSILQMGSMPHPVASGFVEGLYAKADHEGVIDIDFNSIKVGYRVRMVDGPFDELEGILQERNDGNRVILLMNLMGRQMRVHASIDSLVAVS